MSEECPNDSNIGCCSHYARGGALRDALGISNDLKHNAPGCCANFSTCARREFEFMNWLSICYCLDSPDEKFSRIQLLLNISRGQGA